jgi:hypothetical protein
MHPSLRNILAAAGVLAAVALFTPTTSFAGPAPSGPTGDVAYDFTNVGFYARIDSTSWQKLHTSLSPVTDNWVLGDVDGSGTDDIVASFDNGGSVVGMYQRIDGGGWVKITNNVSTNLAVGQLNGAAGLDTVATFSGVAGTWVRYDNGSWELLSNFTADTLSVGDIDGNGTDDVLFSFNIGGDATNTGVWVRFDNGGYKKLNNSTATILDGGGNLDGAAGDDVVIVFAGTAGTWVYQNNASLVKVSVASAATVAVGDITGTGIDSLVAGFTSLGTFYRSISAGWTQLHGSNALALATGQVDDDTGNRDEIITTLNGVNGSWSRVNLTSWQQTNNDSHRSAAVGQLN